MIPLASYHPPTPTDLLPHKSLPHIHALCVTYALQGLSV